MKKYISIVLVIVVILFGYLFIRRGNELPSVQNTVASFFVAVSENRQADYESLEVTGFKEIFANLLIQYPKNFENVASVDEGTGSLKISTETGTTFEYVSIINYKSGQKLGITVKLVKEDMWLIYGIYFNEINK